MKTTLSRKGLWKGIAKQFWGIIKLPIWIQQRLLIRLLCWIPFCCLSQCEVTRHCFPPPAALRTSPSTALGRLTLQELLPLLQSVYSRFEKGDCKPQQQKEKRGKAKQWLQIKQWQQSHEGRAGECLSHEECPKTGYRSGLPESLGMPKINAQFVELLVQLPQCRDYVTARRSSLNDWQRPIGGSRSQLSLCLHTGFLSQAKFL